MTNQLEKLKPAFALESHIVVAREPMCCEAVSVIRALLLATCMSIYQMNLTQRARIH